MILKLALRNLLYRPLSTVLSLVLLVSGVAIITLLILLERQFEKQFSSNLDSIDLVMGAQGSPLQLILSAVYQMDAPTGNISYRQAQVYMKHPFVKHAVPLAYGDNYNGYRIVGTTPGYLEHYGAGVGTGSMFARSGEVVLGAQVAEKLALKIGDSFYGIHGDDAAGEVHDHALYKVVGIAQASGKVADNLILTTIETVWSMHEPHEHHGDDHSGEQAEIPHQHTAACNHDHDHDHDHHEEGHAQTQDSDELNEPGLAANDEKEITAVLLKIKNKMALVSWPRLVAQNTTMQMASPAVEVNRLFTLFGFGLQALRYLAYGIMFISALSIFIALFSELRERKYEFALMRISGAGQTQLFSLVLIESLLLCTIGFFAGTIVGRLALTGISRATESEYKISFDPMAFEAPKEGLLFVVTLVIGLLAALIPAIMAYRLNISKTLAHA
jgi:putative ABC transport system permease protein